MLTLSLVFTLLGDPWIWRSQYIHRFTTGW
jgi:hypothetical protein